MLKPKSSVVHQPRPDADGQHDFEIHFDLHRQQQKNGTKKWPKIKIMLTHHHEPCSRMRYQKVSSGMLAFQTTKYCANSE